MAMLPALRSSTLGITLFAVVTSALIAITQVLTEDIIKSNIKDAKIKALYEVVDKERLDNDLLASAFVLEANKTLGHAQAFQGYRAQHKGQTFAVIFPVVAPDGYSGDINLIVAIKADGSVSGVRVLNHKETPGLGDKIEIKKSDWIASLTGQRNDNAHRAQFAVVKDGGHFDQFSGATITPRAVVNATSRALDYFRENTALLLNKEPK